MSTPVQFGSEIDWPAVIAASCGVTLDLAKDALAQCEGDVESAVETLVAGHCAPVLSPSGCCPARSRCMSSEQTTVCQAQAAEELSVSCGVTLAAATEALEHNEYDMHAAVEFLLIGDDVRLSAGDVATSYVEVRPRFSLTAGLITKTTSACPSLIVFRATATEKCIQDRLPGRNNRSFGQRPAAVGDQVI
jgi:hypothetical protein